MKKEHRVGICALTGKKGQFVKSHILPRALTKIATKGQKVIEAGLGKGKADRLDTWYDDQLCTQDGETILERIDTRGIDLLRDLNLIWSGWNSHDTELVATKWDHLPINEGPRIVTIPDEAALRLFLLSLIWRSSASRRREFSDFKLLPEEEESMRKRVASEDPAPPDDFPVLLFQLSTRGYRHNRTPIIEKFEFEESDGTKSPLYTRVRIYLDGFISHIILPRGAEFSEELRKLFLGNNDKAMIFTNKFEDSRTFVDMKEVILTVEKDHHTLPHKKNPIAELTSSLFKPQNIPR